MGCTTCIAIAFTLSHNAHCMLGRQACARIRPLFVQGLTLLCLRTRDRNLIRNATCLTLSSWSLCVAHKRGSIPSTGEGAQRCRSKATLRLKQGLHNEFKLLQVFLFKLIDTNTRHQCRGSLQKNIASQLADTDEPAGMDACLAQMNPSVSVTHR